ncbi:hypothetical protein QJQ45_025143, partial [Haematococcus lacustris]
DVVAGLRAALGCSEDASSPTAAYLPCELGFNLVELFVAAPFRTLYFAYGTRFPTFQPGPSAPLSPADLTTQLSSWWTAHGLADLALLPPGLLPPSSHYQAWFRAIDVHLLAGMSSLLQQPPAWLLLRSTDHLGVTCSPSTPLTVTDPTNATAAGRSGGGSRVPGPLPPDLFATAFTASGLRTLAIVGCGIGGPLPEQWTLPGMGPLPTSQYVHAWPLVLRLPGNQLSGPLPSSWLAWANCSLSQLDLSDNRLTAQLPASFLDAVHRDASFCREVEAGGGSVADAAVHALPFVGPGLQGRCAERRMFYAGVIWDTRAQHPPAAAWVNLAFDPELSCRPTDPTCRTRVEAAGAWAAVEPALLLAGNTVIIPGQPYASTWYALAPCPRSAPLLNLLIAPHHNTASLFHPELRVWVLWGAALVLLPAAALLGWLLVLFAGYGGGPRRVSESSGTAREAEPGSGNIADAIQHGLQAALDMKSVPQTDVVAMGAAARLERELKGRGWLAYMLLAGLLHGAWTAVVLVLVLDMSRGGRHQACRVVSSADLKLCSGALLPVLVATLLLPGAAVAVLACGLWGWRNRAGHWWHKDSRGQYTHGMPQARHLFSWLALGAITLLATSLLAVLGPFAPLLAIASIARREWRAAREVAFTRSLTTRRPQVAVTAASAVAGGRSTSSSPGSTTDEGRALDRLASKIAVLLGRPGATPSASTTAANPTPASGRASPARVAPSPLIEPASMSAVTEGVVRGSAASASSLRAGPSSRARLTAAAGWVHALEGPPDPSATGAGSREGGGGQHDSGSWVVLQDVLEGGMGPGGRPRPSQLPLTRGASFLGDKPPMLSASPPRSSKAKSGSVPLSRRLLIEPDHSGRQSGSRVAPEGRQQGSGGWTGGWLAQEGGPVGEGLLLLPCQGRWFVPGPGGSMQHMPGAPPHPPSPPTPSPPPPSSTPRPNPPLGQGKGPLRRQLPGPAQPLTRSQHFAKARARGPVLLTCWPPPPAPMSLVNS